MAWQDFSDKADASQLSTKGAEAEFTDHYFGNTHWTARKQESKLSASWVKTHKVKQMAQVPPHHKHRNHPKSKQKISSNTCVIGEFKWFQMIKALKALTLVVIDSSLCHGSHLRHSCQRIKKSMEAKTWRGENKEHQRTPCSKSSRWSFVRLFLGSFCFQTFLFRVSFENTKLLTFETFVTKNVWKTFEKTRCGKTLLHLFLASFSSVRFLLWQFGLERIVTSPQQKAMVNGHSLHKNNRESNI